MKVTQKQIAEKVGVSINTVSLAMRGSSSLSKETTAEILKVANQLGYVNSKSDANEKRKNLCLISTGNRLHDSYFYMSFYQKILRHAHLRGYNIIFLDSSDISGDLDKLNLYFSANSIAGVLILGHIDIEAAKLIKRTNLPIVAIGVRYDNTEICTVIEDNGLCVYQAIGYLYNRGYQDIGYLGNPGHSESFNERYYNYLRELHRHGLPIQNDCIIMDMDLDDMYNYDFIKDKLRAMPKLPQAFLCANDNTAMIVSKALQELGFNVPKDIAIVGIDNASVGKMTIPTLTSVDVRVDMQAQYSIDKLISFVEGAPYEAVRILIPTQLEEGQSVK
ncbi:MAG: LacI family transcriptional regulator [Clostridiales Family XIII bacterium]|jgi:LacI family transcriptional regulator|nr:LacI family transcriptional regulator [Clostridiales Family XIII bacterium]